MSGPRKRSRFIPEKGAGGGGGGGPSPTALVEWGPDFGESAGNDDNTWTGGFQQEPIEEVALENNSTLGTGLDLDSLDMENDSTFGAAYDFQTLDLEGNRSLGLAGQTPIISSPRETHSFMAVDYLHWAKTEAITSGGGAGCGQPDQDDETTHYYGFSQRGPNQYGPIGQATFSINAETLAGVSEDRRVALYKFPLHQFDTANGWLTNGAAIAGDYAIGFSVEATNTAPAGSNIVTAEFKYGSTNPWTGVQTSWNTTNNGNPSGSQIGTSETASIAAGATTILSWTKTGNQLANVLNNNWVWVRLTTDATRTFPITLNTRHASGLPNDNPGDFKAGVLYFRAYL